MAAQHVDIGHRHPEVLTRVQAPIPENSMIKPKAKKARNRHQPR